METGLSWTNSPPDRKSVTRVSGAHCSYSPATCSFNSYLRERSLRLKTSVLAGAEHTDRHAHAPNGGSRSDCINIPRTSRVVCLFCISGGRVRACVNVRATGLNRGQRFLCHEKAITARYSPFALYVMPYIRWCHRDPNGCSRLAHSSSVSSSASMPYIRWCHRDPNGCSRWCHDRKPLQSAKGLLFQGTGLL